MDPVTGALIGGGIESGGGVISSAMNLWGASKNRQFQERMANTAHQREVADLRAAGINPMLSGMGGSGSAVPAGNVAAVENPLAGIGRGVASASRISGLEQPALNNATASTLAQILQTESQVKLNSAKEAESRTNATLTAAKVPWEEMLSALAKAGIPLAKLGEEGIRKLIGIIQGPGKTALGDAAAAAAETLRKGASAVGDTIHGGVNSAKKTARELIHGGVNSAKKTARELMKKEDEKAPKSEMDFNN